MRENKSIKNQTKKYILDDLSLWALLFSNVLTIFFAIIEGWNLLVIMWIYWFQSVIIGFFNFIRILQLKDFSTEGFTINNKPAKPTHETKIFTAFFFLAHYGIFHLVYLAFLLTGGFENTRKVEMSIIDMKFILLTVFLFFINHLFSFVYNKPRDNKKQNIGTLMFYPYARIIPMHFTIVMGSFFGKAILPFFLILKTFSDVIMHVVEHQVVRKKPQINIYTS